MSSLVSRPSMIGTALRGSIPIKRLSSCCGRAPCSPSTSSTLKSCIASSCAASKRTKRLRDSIPNRASRYPQLANSGDDIDSPIDLVIYYDYPCLCLISKEALHEHERPSLSDHRRQHGAW